MKKSLLIILVLFACGIAHAQNYNCLQYGPVTFFMNGNNYMRGIRIDSVRAVGADTLYYPFKTERVMGYNSYSIFPPVYDFDGGSWLGGQVLRKSDGTWLFDNMWHDTVIIKSQAAVGESWSFFNDTTNISYIATVIAIDTLTIGGVVDSVKTIEILADTAGIHRTWDPVDHFQLKLTKDHGFAQAFDLYTFPYHLPDSTSDIIFLDFYLDFVIGRNEGFGELHPLPLRGPVPDTINSVFKYIDFPNPMTKDVYDFWEGDVYVYNAFRNVNPYVTLEDQYVDSVLSSSSTPYTHTYSSVEHCVYGTNNMGNWTFTYSTSAGSYTGDTTRLFDFYKMPEEKGCSLHYYYYPNDSFSGATCYAQGRYTIRASRIDTDTTHGQYPVHYTHGVDFGVQYLGSGTVDYFVGLGMVATRYDSPEGMAYKVCSFIYKGGGVCYGVFTPEKLDSIDFKRMDVQLLPNPANDKLLIKPMNAYSAITLHIVNMIGQTNYYQVLDPAVDNEINVASLPAGRYNVILEDHDGNRVVKPLIVMH